MSEAASESATPETSTSTSEPAKTTEWYEQELTKVRQEAANNRVKGKEKADATRAEVTTEFEAKLAESNTAHEATKAELSAAVLNNTKLNTALAAVLGDEVTAKVLAFAKTVQGSTEDELKAHAEELKSLFGITGQPATTPATDPSQGLGGEAPAGDDFGSWLNAKFLNR